MFDINKWTEIEYYSPEFIEKLKANNYEVQSKELLAHWSINEDDYEYLTGKISEYGYETFVIDKGVVETTDKILENTPFDHHVTRVCYILKKCYYERLRFELRKANVIPDLKSLYEFLGERTNKITLHTFNAAKKVELVNPHIIKIVKLFLIENILTDRDSQHLLAYTPLKGKRAKGSHHDKTDNYHFFKAMTMLSFFLKSTDEYKAGNISESKCYNVIYDILFENSFLPEKELKKDIVLDSEKHKRIRDGIRDNIKNFKYLQNTFLRQENDIPNLDDDLEKEIQDEQRELEILTEDDHYIEYVERRAEISKKIEMLLIKLQS